MFIPKGPVTTQPLRNMPKPLRLPPETASAPNMPQRPLAGGVPVNMLRPAMPAPAPAGAPQDMSAMATALAPVSPRRRMGLGNFGLGAGAGNGLHNTLLAQNKSRLGY